MFYAPAERNAMRSFQRYKDVFFRPIFVALTWLHITANYLSVLSGTTAFIGIVWSLAVRAPGIFIAALWIHVFLDAIDGGLARFQNRTNGAVTDVIADMIALVSTTVYGYIFAGVPLWLCLTFIVSYIALVVLAFVREGLGIPYPFVARPRFIVYSFLTADYLFNGATATPIFLASTIPPAALSVMGLVVLIRHYLKKPSA